MGQVWRTIPNRASIHVTTTVGVGVGIVRWKVNSSNLAIHKSALKCLDWGQNRLVYWPTCFEWKASAENIRVLWNNKFSDDLRMKTFWVSSSESRYPTRHTDQQYVRNGLEPPHTESPDVSRSWARTLNRERTLPAQPQFQPSLTTGISDNPHP